MTCLNTRLEEHKNNINKHNNFQSIISHHRINNGHNFDWSTPHVLYIESHKERNRRNGVHKKI